MGVDVSETVKAVDEDKIERDIQLLGESLYKYYGYKKEAYAKLRSALEEYVADEKKRKLVIIIDELDRVRPTYAIEYLEAIKHIFSIKGLSFVVAVDRDQLEKSVSQVFGKIDFDNYYLKFVSREMQLPPKNADNVVNFLGHIFNRTIRPHGSELSSGVCLNEVKAIGPYVAEICEAFGFSARKIERYYLDCIQFFCLSENESLKKSEWLKAAFFLIAVKHSNKASLEDALLVQEGNIGVIESPFFEVIHPKKGNLSHRRDMLLIVLAFMINDNKNVDNAAEIYMRFSESKIDSQHKALAVRQIESIVNTQVYSPFSYFYRLNAEYLEWSELFVG